MYYYQSGLAAEEDGHVLVSVTAVIHEPKCMTRSMRLRIPGERYIRLLEMLQAQTRARFTQGRHEYMRHTRNLRAILKPA